MRETVVTTTAAAGAEQVLTTQTVAATFAQKALRIAMLALPIVAIVSGVIALGNAMGFFGDSTEDAEKAQEKLDKQLEKTNKQIENQKKVTTDLTRIIDGQTQEEINKAKLRGASESELTKIQEEGARRRIKILEYEEKESRKLFLKITKTFTDRKEVEAAEKAYNEISNQLFDERLALETSIADRIYQARINKAKEQAKDEKDIKLLSNDELYKIEQAELKRQNDAELKAIQESERNVINAQNELLNALELIAEENRQRFLSNQENEIQAVNDKYFTLEELAKGNAEQLKEIEIAKANELNDINLKYQNQKLELDKKVTEEQKKIDAEKTASIIANIEKVLEVAQGVQNTFTAFNNLLNAQDNERLKQVRGNTAEEEKIKRKMFEREKRLRLSQVAIDTASAIVKSVQASPATFGLPFSAFALATGIANAQAIKATTFDGGSTPSSGGTPSTGATASSFTQQSNQTTETNLTGVNLPTQNTTKVVVLESDITKIQNRVRVQETTSTY
jgi:hypothetical protein